MNLCSFSLLLLTLSQVNCEKGTVSPVTETTEKRSESVDSTAKSILTEDTKKPTTIVQQTSATEPSLIVNRIKEHEKVIESIFNAHFPKQNIGTVPPVVESTHSSTDLKESNTVTTKESVVPDSIGTRILLFTRKNANVAENLFPSDESTLNQISNFQNDKTLRVIIHGSFDGLDSGHWMTDMKDKFLQRDEDNVILVDWNKGAAANLLDQRMTNVRMLGSRVADVLKNLIKLRNVKPEDIHIIAHSLGTFAADVIGRQIRNLGRISALDPGGLPNFDLLPTDMRLDSSDALFVDAIHTDVKNSSVSLYGRGTPIPVGHMDFFPNGGSDQPGCNVQRFEDLIIRPIGEGVRRFVACHHYRAIDYFLDTILPTSSNCLMIAYRCENYTNFLDGKCSTCEKPGIDCAEMGFRSIDYFKEDDNKSKKFYILTNRRRPFCLYHYNIEVTLNQMPDQIRGGVLFIKPLGEFGSMETRVNGGMNGFRSGNTSGSVVTHFLDIGATRSLTLGWIPAPSINLFSDPSLYVQRITVTPMTFTDKKSRSLLTRTLCPSETTAIQPFYRRTFFATKGYCGH